MARHDEGLAGEVIGRVVSSEVDERGLTTVVELEPLVYKMFADGFPAFAPGHVDDGPDSWAFILTVAIVSLAIAAAIFVEGLI